MSINVCLFWSFNAPFLHFLDHEESLVENRKHQDERVGFTSLVCLFRLYSLISVSVPSLQSPGWDSSGSSILMSDPVTSRYLSTIFGQSTTFVIGLPAVRFCTEIRKRKKKIEIHDLRAWDSVHNYMKFTKNAQIICYFLFIHSNNVIWIFKCCLVFINIIMDIYRTKFKEVLGPRR